MKRKYYKRPTMKVVELKQRCHILAGSGQKSAGVQDYTVNGYYEE